MTVNALISSTYTVSTTNARIPRMRPRSSFNVTGLRRSHAHQAAGGCIGILIGGFSSIYCAFPSGNNDAFLYFSVPPTLKTRHVAWTIPLNDTFVRRNIHQQVGIQSVKPPCQDTDTQQ